ncbi:hypothetical protein [Thalassotalea sp. PLHSN55]|uniref:hypothetical protein n=1 Tax=Thalassotalea sp. PLHSN55 TaxID=3435888 RepID=UPI003F830DD1
MFYRFSTIVLLLCSATVWSAEITVYRWVDDKNIVHFSQHQPAHDNYTELTMAQAVQVSQEVKTPSVQQQLDAPLASTETQEPEAKSVQEESSEKCAAARLNLKTLATFDKIQYTDANGDIKVLTNQQKNQQQALGEKQVEVYCNN